MPLTGPLGRTAEVADRGCPVYPAPPPINIGSTMIERVTKFKLLGVTVQNDLKWNAHVSTIVKKASKRIYFVRACRKANLPSNIGLTTPLYQDKTFPGIYCTDLGRSALLFKGGYRKSPKTLS